MPTARKFTVVPGQPGFFHCVSRCVRRAWLCGTDSVSGNNYDHRRDWMVKRMHQITTCFAIDVYAYAFMDNHYHIVLYVDPDRVDSWTDEQVVRQWKTLWNWRRPNRALVIPDSLPSETIQKWRERLADVSWAMRLLNEPIARIANAEDDTKGHFWESRFKCTPLLDDPGLVMSMVYADLNPIKAGIALTPEDSDYTSIQQRIRQLAMETSTDDSESNENQLEVDQQNARDLKDSLEPVSTNVPQSAPILGITQESYIELVEMTAEAIRDKRAIRSTAALVSLGIKPSGWLRAITDFLLLFRTAAGSDASFTQFMKRTGLSRRQDAASRRMLLS